MKKLGLVIGVVLAIATTSQATDYTWDGGGDPDHLWSNVSNWDANGKPVSANTAVVIFSGTTNLIDNQDIAAGAYNNFTAGFTLNKITYDTTATAARLMLGQNLVDHTPHDFNMAGTNPTILDCATGVTHEIRLRINPVAGNNYFQVESGATLNLSGYITGGTGYNLHKTGGGTLMVNNFGYDNICMQKPNNVGPSWFIDDGKVIFGLVNSTKSYWDGTKWVKTTADWQFGGTYGLTIGDGIGAAQSAVVELDDTTPSTVYPLYGTSGITVNTDGKFDMKSLSGPFGATNVVKGLITGSTNGSYWYLPAGTTTFTGGKISFGGTRTVYIYGSMVSLADPNGQTAVFECTGTGKYLVYGGTGNFNIADTLNQPIDFKLGMPHGAGPLNKQGAGTLLITGNSDSTGTTTIENGTLLVTGITSGQGDYTVKGIGTAPGKLGGTGTIGLAAGKKVDILAGGILAPGMSVGTLTVGASNAKRKVVFENGAIYEWQLDNDSTSPLGYDQLKVYGNATFGATAILKVIRTNMAFTPDPTDVFTLVDCSDNAIFNSTVWTIDLSQAGGLMGGRVRLDNVDPKYAKKVLLDQLTIPEPATILLLGTGVLGLLGYVRRRRMS